MPPIRREVSHVRTCFENILKALIGAKSPDLTGAIVPEFRANEVRAIIGVPANYGNRSVDTTWGLGFLFEKEITPANTQLRFILATGMGEVYRGDANLQGQYVTLFYSHRGGVYTENLEMLEPSNDIFSGPIAIPVNDPSNLIENSTLGMLETCINAKPDQVNLALKTVEKILN